MGFRRPYQAVPLSVLALAAAFRSPPGRTNAALPSQTRARDSANVGAAAARAFTGAYDGARPAHTSARPATARVALRAAAILDDLPAPPSGWADEALAACQRLHNAAVAKQLASGRRRNTSDEDNAFAIVDRLLAQGSGTSAATRVFDRVKKAMQVRGSQNLEDEPSPSALSGSPPRTPDS